MKEFKAISSIKRPEDPTVVQIGDEGPNGHVLVGERTKTGITFMAGKRHPNGEVLVGLPVMELTHDQLLELVQYWETNNKEAIV